MTGDYGSGKSSFALILAHLLRDSSDRALAHIRKAVDFRGSGGKGSRVVPILVTGARESFVPAVARSVARAIDQLRGRGRPPKALAELAHLAASVARGADVGALVELLQDVTAYVVGAGHSGVLLVIDELGKFLEYAALHPEREDVYTLQRIAEAAVRSGQQPLFVIGLLHQGFHAYAERLPTTARHEWEKVAERFDEIVFDQPLGHTAALVSGALNVDRKRIPDAVMRRARMMSLAIQKTGWFSDYAGLANDSPHEDTARPSRRVRSAFDPLAVYPLHPTVLPVLVRFFARFGQHERSLFGFLLSSEPFALQHFVTRRALGDAWYRLADFYDYVRAVFGHRLAGASYRSQWLRISGVVEGLADLSEAESKVLKTVAMLNLIDADHLLATDAVLGVAVGDREGPSVAGVVKALKSRGILYDRGSAGGYCLWSTTSVNLEFAFEAARRALGPIEGVAVHLKPYLDQRPLLARRHSILTGTLRYFEVRYTDVAGLRDAVAQPSEADGIVVVSLCDTPAQRFEAMGATTSDAIAGRPDVVIAVPPPLQSMTAEVQDARCWTSVAENTPELAHDPYAAAEVARHVAASRRLVATRLAEITGLQVGRVSPPDHPTDGVAWTRAGQLFDVGYGRGLLSALSDICDMLYYEAPRIRNELLNRRNLSSPAAAARMRLIERMFTSSSQALLGIDPVKAPPEKSMYLSVLSAGNVHRQEGGRFILSEPPDGDDPLHLRPALRRLMEVLEEGDGHRVPVPRLIAALSERPFGVRAGVVPLLLAVVATSHAHELAVYENGTFLQRFGPSDFLRLTKVPTAFELQLCRVTGVRVEVFNQLAEVFASARDHHRRAELLDVVSPLCVFAAQLPESTRKTAGLPAAAAAVRDCLLSAREPGPLLFHDLPIACGLDAFSPEQPADRRRVRMFVAALREAMDDLRGAFPQLLLRVGIHATRAMGEPAGPSGLPLDREHLADRARRVAVTAREPRLRAFAHRLADIKLDDDAWADALGSFIIAKPPMRWAQGDEARACDEIDVLATTFRRVEGLVFANDLSGHGSAMSAVRVGLTRGDGTEVATVIHTHPADQASVDAAVVQIRAILATSPELRLAALSQALWEDLEGSPDASMTVESAGPGNSVTTTGREHP